MKSFIAGLATIIILGIVGFYTFKATSSFLYKLNPSPSASATTTPVSTPTPTIKPSSTPEPSSIPTTKGGQVKGVSSTPKTKTTTTTTTSRLYLTLVKSSICPISYMTEVKDITGPLTLRYELIDNTSFGITVWNKNGNELLGNTTYSGRSGMIKTISGVDYMKVRIESKTCAGSNDNWIKITAER